MEWEKNDWGSMRRGENEVQIEERGALHIFLKCCVGV